MLDSSSVQIAESIGGHSGRITGLVYLGNKTLVSISHDQSIRKWNLETGECIVSNPIQSNLGPLLAPHTHTGYLSARPSLPSFFTSNALVSARCS